jgi:hypothetical protein
MISVGPTIEHPHSPDERLEIASVGKVYDLLVATLQRISARCMCECVFMSIPETPAEIARTIRCGAGAAKSH